MIKPGRQLIISHEYYRHLCQVSIDTFHQYPWLTSWSVLNQHLDQCLLDIWSTVGQKSAECWPTRMHWLKSRGRQLSTEISMEYWWSVNWDADGVSIEQPSDVDWGSIKGISGHEFNCRSLCSTGSKSSLITPSHLPGAPPLMKPFNNFVSVRSKLNNTIKVTYCSITECSISALFQCYLTRTYYLLLYIMQTGCPSTIIIMGNFKIVTHKSLL